MHVARADENFFRSILNFYRGWLRRFDHRPGRVLGEFSLGSDPHAHYTVAKSSNADLRGFRRELHSVLQHFDVLDTSEMMPTLRAVPRAKRRAKQKSNHDALRED